MQRRRHHLEMLGHVLFSESPTGRPNGKSFVPCPHEQRNSIDLHTRSDVNAVKMRCSRCTFDAPSKRIPWEFYFPSRLFPSAILSNASKSTLIPHHSLCFLAPRLS